MRKMWTSRFKHSVSSSEKNSVIVTDSCLFLGAHRVEHPVKQLEEVRKKSVRQEHNMRTNVTVSFLLNT